MKVKFWGVRGSIPAPPSPSVIESKICSAILNMPQQIDHDDPVAVYNYVRSLPPLERGTAGGHTSCVEIKSGPNIIIIDAGSGIYDLGLELLRGPCGRGQGTIHLFFTHAHWDHIQGFPFFKPAYIPGNHIYIYAVHDMEAVLRDQQRFINFPVAFDFLAADMTFIQIEPGKPFDVGKVQINTIQNAHPGHSYSYRFEDEFSIFVHASDAEYKQLDNTALQPYIDFFQNADALVFDAQFTLKEGWQKEDWGHSSAMIGVDLARAAGVKKLLLFHYDPAYKDAKVYEMLTTALAYEAQDASTPSVEVLLAYEGLFLDLTPPGLVEMQIDGESAILTPTSVFDERSVEQLTHQLAQLSEQPIIDLSQVEKLTTASLKSLVAAIQQSQNGPIVLADPSSAVLKVIELGGYSDFFVMYASVEAAQTALQARDAAGLPGQLFNDRYIIEAEMGANWLGTLLKATDTAANRTVALRIFSPTVNQSVLERYVRQEQQLTSLDHPNVLHVFDVGQVDGFFYVVEEFCEAVVLEQYVEDDEFDADIALNLSFDLTTALEYIHSRGLVHGNLSLRNVFVTDAGIKLSGVGLGRLEEGRPLLSMPLLRTSTAFLAPEQILGQPLDSRTDLYALGIMLYRMFTGELPFKGTDEEILNAHISQTPRPPRELNPYISPALEHLILKLVAKNPNARYTSAEQTRRISTNLIVNDGAEAKKQKQLVGRDKQLGDLMESWHASLGGSGQLTLISGDLGIGKTSLIHLFVSQVNPPVTLIGNCRHESTDSVAYHPFAEALQTYFATAPVEFFDETAQQLIANFARLIPNIEQMLPHLEQPAPLEPKQEQLRLMSSLTRFIKQATESRPWLLVLEDLQWADPNSLELLHYMAHHVSSMALMIVGTYRDSVLETGHRLLETIRDLSRHTAYQHVVLPPLSWGQVEQVLTRNLEQTAPPSLVERIYHHTGGNPFYIEEMMRGLINDGVVTMRDGMWTFNSIERTRLPNTVHEAVWNRVGHLSPDTQTLLQQAAVLGGTFKFEHLCQMSGRSEWEVLEHLDLALERQLIQEVNAEGALQFSHAAIQHVLYNDIGPLRRRMFHRMAGEVLEQSASTSPETIAAKLAYHFGEAGDFERAFVFALQAANHAKKIYDNQTAMLWYERVLEMLQQLNADEVSMFQPVRLAVHQALGEVSALVGQYDNALLHYAQARTLAQLVPQSPNRIKLLAELSYQTAEVYDKRRDYETSLKWVEKGLTHLSKSDPTIQIARLYLMGARSFDRRGLLTFALDWCQESLALVSQIAGREREEQQTTAQAYALLASVCLRLGDFDLVLKFSQESIDVYRTVNDVMGQIYAYNTMGAAYIVLGDWKEAHKAFTTSLEVAQAVGDINAQADTNINLTRLYLAQGKWSQATDLLRQTLDIWQQTRAVGQEALALNWLAQAHMQQGDWAEAAACLKQGQIALKQADSEEARRHLAQSWAMYYLLTGQLDDALPIAQEYADLAIEQQEPLATAIGYRTLGLIYIAQGEHAPAETMLNRSLTLCRQLRASYELARAQLALAQLLVAQNSAQEAQAYLDEATETLQALGAHPDLDMAHQLAEQLQLLVTSSVAPHPPE